MYGVLRDFPEIEILEYDCFKFDELRWNKKRRTWPFGEMNIRIGRSELRPK
jgi:hypothetical protein